MRSGDADALIEASAFGRHQLTAIELSLVLAHIADAGFDPHGRERARGELSGIRWHGTALSGADYLPPAERHYVKHAIVRREWPEATTLSGYLASLQRVIHDPSSGVFTSLYQGAAQLSIIRDSGALRGTNGHEFVLIDYRVVVGHWVTAYQPERGLEDLTDPPRTDVRWWRAPRRLSG